MDLSHLNKFVVPARFPLATLPEIFQKVCSSAFLSTLDLRKAYRNITLHPESWPLILTMMPLGPRQYIKMPLGLKDLGTIFQWAIHETLQDCPGAVPHIDNILVSRKTKQNMIPICGKFCMHITPRTFSCSCQSAGFARLLFPTWATSSWALSCDPIQQRLQPSSMHPFLRLHSSWIASRVWWDGKQQ